MSETTLQKVEAEVQKLTAELESLERAQMYSAAFDNLLGYVSETPEPFSSAPPEPNSWHANVGSAGGPPPSSSGFASPEHPRKTLHDPRVSSSDTPVFPLEHKRNLMALNVPPAMTQAPTQAAQQGQGNAAIAPYHSASLYVGDLSKDVAEATLFEIFSQVGPVASIRVCRDTVTRRSLGYAYVNFHNVADAERALDTMNFTTIKDQACRIMWSQRDPSLRRSGVGNIFVKNLDETVDNKALYDTFSLFGNILSCKVATDDAGESKGYGYVHYETGVSANMAITKINGMLIAGKQVHVGHFVRRDNRAGQADWTNLYVKGLPSSWDDAKLREEFEKHGAVTSCKVQVTAADGEESKDKDKEKASEGKSRGFGFVNFEEHDAAVKAIEAFNGTEVPDGEGTTTLYCARAQKKSERARELQSKHDQVKMERMNKFQGVNVYVKNLDEGVTEDALREAFAPYGTITSARVMVDNSNNNQSKGFGFVCFSAPEEATKAITEMNGKMLLNKPIYVALAQRREVRRTQLEAQFAQRTGGMPPRGMPMPGGAQGMYNMPYWMGAQPGMPQQPRQYMMPQMMPRGPRGPMPAFGGRGNYPMPAYATAGQQMPGQPQPRRGAGPRQQRGQPQPQGGRGGPQGRGMPQQPQGPGGPGRGNFKYNQGVRNQQPGAPNMPPQQQQQQQQQQGAPQQSMPGPVPQAAPATNESLSAAALAAAPPEKQKNMIGERLYPLIYEGQPALAGKITGMLLEMDNGELLHLLESPEALSAKINEALQVSLTAFFVWWNVRVAGKLFMTYGSNRRPTSSIRGSAASSSRGGIFRSQTATGGAAAGGGQFGSTSVGLSSAYEEEARTPQGESMPSTLMRELDASPIELAFTARGLDLGLESPGDGGAPAAAAAAGKARAATKPKKPATRSRRGAGRTQTTTAAAVTGSRGSSAHPAGNAEAAEAPARAPAPAPAPRRKTPAARKTRAARGCGAGSAALPIEIGGEGEGFISSDGEVGRPRASPSARRSRDRSPLRRGSGRPDRRTDRGNSGSATRNPSSPLSSPLMPITNYTSEGDRQTRTKAKVKKEAVGGATSSAAAPELSGGGGAENNSSSSGEEEWRDDDMDFTKRDDESSPSNVNSININTTESKAKRAAGNRPTARVDGRRRKGDGKAARAAAAPSARGTRRSAREKTRATPAARAKAGDWLAKSSGAGRVEGPAGGGDMDELEDSEGGEDAVERGPLPLPLLSPGGATSAEVKLSLDSSVEGVLVGDKRPRGSSGGKRGARVAEDNAHRSSRSRHLSPMIPVSGGFVGYGFSVEEKNENGSEQDDVAIDATPTPDDGSDLDDGVIDLPPSTSTEAMPPTTASTGAETGAAASPPSGPGGLGWSSSVASGLRAGAPVLAMTTSPALVGLNNRRSGHDAVVDVDNQAEVEVSAATALAQAAASAEEFDAERWEDNSNDHPASLSRSLSSSHASGPAGWGPAGAAAGCAKVTRSSHRRRSRANSTSSPLPVLEMSASMPAGGVGFADAKASDWTTRSYGSAGFSRHARRGSYGGGIVGGCGGIADVTLRKFSSCGGGGGDSKPRRDSTGEVLAVRGSAPLSRSHRMPALGQENGGGLKSVGRPISLPSGIGVVQRERLRGVEGGLPAAEASSPGGGGDGGFGWVLRSPGAPLDHRRRSRSFAGGRAAVAREKPDSTTKFSSASGVRELPLPGFGEDCGEGYGLPGAWAERDSEGQGAMLGNDDQDEDMAPAQTPQASPSKQGTSAALHRAHGLSSMARRMDRLEIRSPNVETHAAQAQLEIMGNPMSDNVCHSSGEVAPPAESSSGTPVHHRGDSLPSHFTPVGNWNSTNDRSRLSGAGGSPTECFRDYLSGHQGQEEEDEEKLPSGDREAKQQGEARALQTPSAAIATPTAPASHSPPGITFTRSTALGLPSPVLAGLFGDANNSGLRQHSGGDGQTPSTASGAVGDTPAGSDGRGRSERCADGGGKDLSGAAAHAAGGNQGGANWTEETRGGGPWQGRKGPKLGLGARSRTVPVRGTQGSPEGGFLIRRKTLGPASCSSYNSGTNGPETYGGEDRDQDASAEPPTLSRLSSGSGSRNSSLYLSCLSSGEGVRSPVEDREAEFARHARSIPSPLPLPEKEFDTHTPSASSKPADLQLCGQDGDGAATSNEGLDATSAIRTTAAESASRDRDRDNRYRSPAFGSLGAQVSTAAPGIIDRGSRRTSTESIGATTCRAQFETPQAETKFKWGSQPQYGDWGISQPASAGSLRHLAGRLMAFAGRGFSGGQDSDAPAGDISSSVMAATTPLRGVTTPLPDLSLPPPPRATATPTPGSTASSRGAGAGSLLTYRNSLGSVSEREEVKRGGGGDGGDNDAGAGVAAGNEMEGSSAHGGDLPGEGGEAEESDAFAEAGVAAPEICALCDPTAFDGGVRQRDRVDGAERSGRRGRDRLSSLLMTEGQREEQRRRQSKAKRRRMSLSIKSRRTSSVGLPARLAGMSLLEVAEASSPGPGKVEQLSRLSPFPKAAAFGGVAISEGEEEDEDEEEQEGKESSVLRPVSSDQDWCPQASPMSVEKDTGESQSHRRRRREDVREGTPAKIREDLEKSLTELNNLSLSICNSEEDVSPAKQRSNKDDSLLGLDSAVASPMMTTTSSSPTAAGMENSGGIDIHPRADLDSAAEAAAVAGACAVVRAVAVRPPALSALEALQRPGVMAKALRMLSVNELLGDVPLVCSAWRKAAVYAFAEVASDMSVRDTDEKESTAAPAATVGRALRGRVVRGKAAAVAVPAAGTTARGAPSRDVWSVEKLMATFPWGGFLSEGACKQVHKVWNAASGNMEALSVMDRRELEEDEEVVSREVRVSILASSLVQRRISPNFVQTFGLFRSAAPLPAKVFGSKEEKYPCGKSPGKIRHQPRGSTRGVSQGRVGRSRLPACSIDSKDLRYQYIGMELCQHGDAEVFIRAQENGLLPTVEAQGFLFQMAFALYAGRAELSLRHFDVKLLNFFVSDASRLLLRAGEDGGAGQDGGAGGVTLRYGIGEDVVELCLPEERPYLVKLADFGTADVDPLTVGNPVEACHFSTLENTPIEQLCCGNQARQGYESDTFALALAAFHLFTGEAPYEEIMEEVECPDDLYNALVSTWDQNPQYVDVCDIIVNNLGEDEDEEVQDDDDDDDNGGQDPTLVHTFYRYLVLFGVPERSRLEEAYGENNPVWKAVGPLLGWKQPRTRKGGRGGGRATASAAAASKRFLRQLEKDQAKFSLDRGRNRFVQRARARLQKLPGAMELVKSMASFVPEDRPTMLEVMRSDMFSSFRRRAAGGDGDARRAQGGSRCVDFMAFARGEGDAPLLAL
eukprot:g11026.t3